MNSFCKWLVPSLQNKWKLSQWFSGHTWKYWAPCPSRSRAALLLQSWAVTERRKQEGSSAESTAPHSTSLILVQFAYCFPDKMDQIEMWVNALCLEMPLHSKTLQGKRLNWKHCTKSIFIRKDYLISNAISALLRFQALFRPPATIQSHPN